MKYIITFKAQIGVDIVNGCSWIFMDMRYNGIVTIVCFIPISPVVNMF